jgi:hypothetical protein
MNMANVRLIKFDSDLLPDVPGLNLPTIENRTYVLVDDDARVCRVIDQDELDASYVDNHIATFKLRDVNWLTLDVDNQFVDITYTNGNTTSLLLGSISYSGGVRTDQYGQTGGVIYPIDAGGNLQLNATNTPQLVAMRVWYYNEAKRVNDERIQIAEIVHAFADVIGHLGHAAHGG